MLKVCRALLSFMPASMRFILSSLHSSLCVWFGNAKSSRGTWISCVRSSVLNHKWFNDWYHIVVLYVWISINSFQKVLICVCIPAESRKQSAHIMEADLTINSHRSSKKGYISVYRWLHKRWENYIKKKRPSTDQCRTHLHMFVCI